MLRLTLLVDSATKTKPLLMVEDKKRVGSEKPPRASDLLAKDDEMYPFPSLLPLLINAFSVLALRFTLVNFYDVLKTNGFHFPTSSRFCYSEALQVRMLFALIRFQRIRESRVLIYSVICLY